MPNHGGRTTAQHASRWSAPPGDSGPSIQTRRTVRPVLLLPERPSGTFGTWWASFNRQMRDDARNMNKILHAKKPLGGRRSGWMVGLVVGPV